MNNPIKSQNEAIRQNVMAIAKDIVYELLSVCRSTKVHVESCLSFKLSTQSLKNHRLVTINCGTSKRSRLRKGKHYTVALLHDHAILTGKIPCRISYSDPEFLKVIVDAIVDGKVD